MKGVKEAFIDAGEISQMLGIGMTKAYAIIKEYNAELEAKGYFTMRGKCCKFRFIGSPIPLATDQCFRL